MIEKITLALEFTSAVKIEEVAGSIIGRHKWDVMEYEKFKFIKLYLNSDLKKTVVVIASSTKDPGGVVDSVIGYINESKETEDIPMNLFD